MWAVANAPPIWGSLVGSVALLGQYVWRGGAAASESIFPQPVAHHLADQLLEGS
jgi:hypothetical protein